MNLFVGFKIVADHRYVDFLAAVRGDGRKTPENQEKEKEKKREARNVEARQGAHLPAGGDYDAYYVAAFSEVFLKADHDIFSTSAGATRVRSVLSSAWPSQALHEGAANEEVWRMMCDVFDYAVEYDELPVRVIGRHADLFINMLAAINLFMPQPSPCMRFSSSDSVHWHAMDPVDALFDLRSHALRYNVPRILEALEIPEPSAEAPAQEWGAWAELSANRLQLLR